MEYNMKKYLALLGLLMITACASANTTNACSDGSSPTKSVSADGSYYVYSCNTTNTISDNPLTQIKVVDNWSPVINFQAFKKESKSRVYWTDGFYKRKYESKSEFNCMSRLTSVTPYPSGQGITAWKKCQGLINTKTKTNIKPLQEILLSWASNPKDLMKVKITNPFDFNPAGYNIPSVLGTFGQLYAIWYDDFRYTPNERKLVDAYMTKKFMEHKFPVINGNSQGRFRPCNPNDPKSALARNVDTNTCGSIRIKVALGEIMLGLRLENQALLDKGNEDIWFVLTQVDADGVWVNYAARGASNFSYYTEYLHHLSILTEIYYALGYDFLEMELKHGAKVHQVYDQGYKLLKDHTVFAKYANRNLGSRMNPYSIVANMTRDQWFQYEQTAETYNDPDDDTDWVNSHTRYVRKYMPHLPIVLGYTQSPQSGTSNISVTPDMLYWGNVTKYVKPKPLPVMDYSLTPKAGDGWRKHYKNVSSN